MTIHPYGHYPQHGPRSIPPPPPPVPPHPVQTAHIVHLVLCFFTFGLWVIVWVIVGLVNVVGNDLRRKRYEQEYRLWQQAYWRWQHSA